MVTKNKIAYDIAMNVGKADDADYVRLIKFNIDYYRAVLIRRDAERNEQNPLYTQLITLPVGPTDAAIKSPVAMGCDIYTTTVSTPIPVRVKDVAPFTYVGTPYIPSKDLLQTIPFTYIKPIQLRYVNELYQGEPLYTFIEDKLYFYYVNPLCYITIEAAFQEPLEAAEASVDSVTCYDDDDPYPAPMDMIEAIVTGILNKSMKLVPLVETPVIPVDEEASTGR